MSLNPLMNEEQLKQWILRRLGAPILKIELTECHIDDSIVEAKTWFSARKGCKRQIQMPVNAGQSEYLLADDIDTVLDVAHAIPPMDLSLVFSPYILLDEKVPYDVFAAPQAAGLYSSYTQTLQYVETAKRILGAEPDWRQEGRKLFLFPMPKNSSFAVVDYKSNVFTLDQLNERDHDLIKRYALACTRRDLGEVRGKFASYPSAQGQISMNGEALKTQAAQEMAALTEEIAQSGFPMGIITG